MWSKTSSSVSQQPNNVIHLLEVTGLNQDWSDRKEKMTTGRLIWLECSLYYPMQYLSPINLLFFKSLCSIETRAASLTIFNGGTISHFKISVVQNLIKLCFHTLMLAQMLTIEWILNLFYVCNFLSSIKCKIKCSNFKDD